MIARWRAILAAGLAGLLAACSAAPTPAPAAGGAKPAETLRIATIAPTAAPCAGADQIADPSAKAYAAHLAARLEREVQLCAATDYAASAALLAGGGAEIAMVDAESFAAVRANARPFLTPRGFEGRGRVETVVATLGSSPRASLNDLAGARLIIAGTSPVQLEEPKRALRDQGVDAAQIEAATVVETPQEAAAALRSGTADVMVIYSAGLQRICRASKADAAPCKDLKEIWRGRPVPLEALAIANALDRETRLRLVGVHVALHLEKPEAMAFIGRGAPVIDAVEAAAFDRSAKP
jgi:ABC-type phosphate/phosphonate transport system substrate-binding protein